MGVEYAYFRGVYDILSSFVAGWGKLNRKRVLLLWWKIGS